MKKTTLASVALVAALGLTLTGCGVSVESADGRSAGSTDQAPTTGTTPDGTDSGLTDGGTTGGTDGGTTGDGTTDVQSLMTPEGATVLGSTPDGLSLTSTKTVDDLVRFYEDAVGRLGATEDESVRTPVTWAYTGTYHGGMRIEIAVTDSGQLRTVAVSWEG